MRCRCAPTQGPRLPLRSEGSKLSFLLIPICLPFLWVLFAARRDVAMYDHAVFARYSLSFMMLQSGC